MLDFSWKYLLTIFFTEILDWLKKALEKLDNSLNAKLEKGFCIKTSENLITFFLLSHKKYRVSVIKRQISLGLFAWCQKILAAIKQSTKIVSSIGVFP